MLYKSSTIMKSLNPRWDDKFQIGVEDAFKPLYCKVFDYDRGMQDDPMGMAIIDLSTLEPNQ